MERRMVQLQLNHRQVIEVMIAMDLRMDELGKRKKDCLPADRHVYDGMIDDVLRFKRMLAREWDKPNPTPNVEEAEDAESG